jgi:hypothetical protein
MTDPETMRRRRELVKSHLLNEHLIAIGNVALRSAMLDTMIDFTIEALSKAYPKLLRDFSLRSPAPQKLELIAQELTKRLPEHESAIDEFIGEIRKAREERADVIHRVWGTTDTDHEKVLIDPRHWKLRPPKRTTANKMMELATRMIDLTFELVDWKALSDQAQLRQSASLRGIDLRGPLPDPPRTSLKDKERREKLRRQRREEPKKGDC